MQQLRSAVGLIGLLLLAWAVPEQRRVVPWRLIASGMVLAPVLAILLLTVPPLATLPGRLNTVLDVFERALRAGPSLVFDYPRGGVPPFAVTASESSFVPAFRALPLALLAPARRAELAELGPTSVLAGLLSAGATTALVGILV